jgi:hypothetical protein
MRDGTQGQALALLQNITLGQKGLLVTNNAEKKFLTLKPGVGVNLLTLFCKQDDFIHAFIVFLYCKKIKPPKKS